MTIKPTSFRFTSHTLVLLKQLATIDNRSLTNYLETLIQEKAKEKGIGK